MHLMIHSRLLSLIKAGGPVDDYGVIGSGRKSAQLDARHREVLGILQSLGLAEASKYHSGFAGKEVPVVNDRDELIPFRPLEAERIKLTETGNWNCAPYLSDLLYLPFVEPRINMFDLLPPRGSFPDVRRSDGKEEFALCFIWDARSLLRNREALVTFLALQEFLGTTKTLSQIGKSETEEGKTFKKDESVDPAVAFL